MATAQARKKESVASSPGSGVLSPCPGNWGDKAPLPQTAGTADARMRTNHEAADMRAADQQVSDPAALSSPEPLSTGLVSVSFLTQERPQLHG